MGRYEATFARLGECREGAFVPFAVMGDPDIETSVEIACTLAGAGADALELGMPFSDPIADGPTIQRATVRAMKSRATPARCWEAIRMLREGGIEIPIGILTYANIAIARGTDAFYSDAAEAGADSVLLADVPLFEAGPFIEAAMRSGVHAILIAPPNASEASLEGIARKGSGYTYVQARPGVTGARERLGLDHSEILKKLREFSAPPPLLGFGISRPEHVRQAIGAGAAGAISGSAIVEIVEKHNKDPRLLSEEIARFVRAMKEATR